MKGGEEESAREEGRRRGRQEGKEMGGEVGRGARGVEESWT